MQKKRSLRERKKGGFGKQIHKWKGPGIVETSSTKTH